MRARVASGLRVADSTGASLAMGTNLSRRRLTSKWPFTTSPEEVNDHLLWRNAMDRTYVVTGAASGIGAATARLLRERGARVVTSDLHDADVIADLATAQGRAALVEGVAGLSG